MSEDYKALLVKVLSYETDIEWLVLQEAFSLEEQELLRRLWHGNE